MKLFGTDPAEGVCTQPNVITLRAGAMRDRDVVENDEPPRAAPHDSVGAIGHDDWLQAMKEVQPAGMRRLGAKARIINQPAA